MAAAHARELAGGLLLALLSGVAALAAGELLVRIAAPQQLVFYRPELYVADARVGWRFAPDLDTRVNTGDRDVGLRTDARGRRVGAPGDPAAGAAAAPALRVLAVGDSFVAGLAVEHSELMTTRLGAHVTQRIGRPVEVVATGVPAWGPPQYASEVEAALAEQRFDAVLVFLFPGNDVSTDWSLSAARLREKLDRRFAWPAAASVAALKAAWLVPLDDRLERRSHLYVFAKQRLEGLRIRLGLSAVSIPPPLLRANAHARDWDVSADVCAGLARAAAREGVPVLFVLLPANYQVDTRLFERDVRLLGLDPASVDLEQPERLLRAALANRGLASVDATQALRAAAAEGAPPLFGRVDAHLSAAGHAVVSEWLAPQLAALLTR